MMRRVSKGSTREATLLTQSRIGVWLVFLCAGLSAYGQEREPVLKQVEVPHRYYYREMYLPQLTTGPNGVAWTPDSQSLVYSMAGTLWKQKLGTAAAEQLTSGPGYDYQPDCSSDGRWIVYSSYAKDAMELWILDLQTRQTHPLTSGGAVNVDPRFSPDGKRIVFVSTSYKGHFHIFLGDFVSGELKNVQRLTGETRSDLPRFYYSQIDHEISPAWSPDGSEIVFITNRGHISGTGGFWRMKAEPGAEAREIHYEETTWRAHPEFSPDGKRLVYASYLGRQWHQLWVMPAQGGEVFPISYGEFDNTNPRWSPDGKNIAFISNRDGNTSVWTQQAVGGAQTEVVARERRYLKPTGTLSIEVVDPAGHPVSARIFLTGEDGRAYAPDDALMHAEDNFVRGEQAFEAHYFHSSRKADATVPVGRVDLVVMKGFEYRVVRKSIQIAAGQHASLTVKLESLNVPRNPNGAWVSADVHLHMNYGGLYRNTPEKMLEQMSAENLQIADDLVVNKEQRIPDIAYFSTRPDPASTAANVLVYGQEFHTSYWGHLGLLGLANHFLLPGYATYGNTAAASMYPDNAAVADMAHEQHALVGYAHPFDFAPDPFNDPSLTHDAPADAALELPVDVALGKVDYIEAMGFSDHRATNEVWYRLLNCGFRLPTASGTDAMANYASLRGPVGLNRAYAEVPLGPLSFPRWLDSLKQGRTFATNAPLLGFTLGGKPLGEELKLPQGNNRVKVAAWMRSIVPVDHLELICNGKVAREFKLNAARDSADVNETIPIDQSGWCLLRAASEKPEFPVLDLYPYATTSPIYVTVTGSLVRPADDAEYFIKWIDRLIAVANANTDWNTASEKSEVLGRLSHARMVYVQLQRPGLGSPRP